MGLFWSVGRESGSRIFARVLRVLLLAPIVLFVGLCHASRPDSGAHPVVTLAGPFTPDSFRGIWYQLLYTEAFKRLGRNFRYLELPLRRATLMARHSTIDGETGRVGSYGEAGADLEKVPVRLWTAHFVAVSHDPDIRVSSWKELKGLAGVVDYRRGVWMAEHQLKQLRTGESINAVTSPVQGLSRLLAGRSTLYVDVGQVVNRTLERSRFRGAPLYEAGVLARMPIYPFLVSKDANLVAPLARVLRKMRDQGLFARYEAMARAMAASN